MAFFKDMKQILICFFFISLLVSCNRKDETPTAMEHSLSNSFIRDPKVFEIDLESEGKNGYTTNYYSNGVIRSQGTYYNGVPHGNWKFYDASGIIWKEGSLHHGEFHGYWKFYYPNGSVQAEGSFSNGQQYGNWKFYYENSKLESEGYFVGSGAKYGNWKYYYPNGQLYAEVYH